MPEPTGVKDKDMESMARTPPERRRIMSDSIPKTSRPDYRLARSHAAYARACRVIPGGVNSPARAFGGVGGEPVFMARGEGPCLFDIDGNTYIDYIGSWGPLILGHGHPEVRAAVVAVLEHGSTFGAPTERETEIAELVAAAVPSIEKVRFVSSGATDETWVSIETPDYGEVVQPN